MDNSINELAISVLYVEDKHINRQVVSMLLKGIGCKVETAVDGYDALEKFKPGKFDLVFMDICMPGLDGIQTTIELNKRYGKELPPIIALSASMFKNDEEEIKKCGMVHYISKPVSKEILEDAIIKYLPQEL